MNIGFYEKDATDYNIGLGVGIAHETGYEGIVNPWLSHLFGPKKDFVDAKSPPTSGAPVFSPEIAQSIIDKLDLE